jgi:predicted nucleotidyltransferase
MNGAEIDAAISSVLRPFPEVSAAWLFGSMARGDARLDSDLDVALLFRTRGTTVLDNYELLGRIAAQLEAVAPGRRIDLVAIEAQGPVFQHRVLSEGRLVHDTEPSRRVDFESDAYVRYFDFAPIHERAKRIAASGFVRWLESRK